MQNSQQMGTQSAQQPGAQTVPVSQQQSAQTAKPAQQGAKVSFSDWAAI